jgi:hypothetical protein
MGIEIKEVVTKKDLKQFVKFPNDLYRGHPGFVPQILSEEIKLFSVETNPALVNCSTKYWLAFKDNQVAGRIAGIINNAFIEKWAKHYARFGWFDVIEDEEVARLLFETVEKWAIDNGMEAINGPLGFTDFDPEGLLVEGFNEKATIIERYNHAYYPEYLDNFGYTKDADWLEFKITVPEKMPEHIKRVSDYVIKRNNFKVLHFNKVSEVLKYSDQIFSIINDIYGLMYGFVPISNELRDFYINKYLKILDPGLMAFVTDPAGKLVAFGIAMPSFAEMFIKAGGSKTKLVALYVLGEHKKTDTVDMYFIGVDPNYIDKGLSAVLISEVGQRIIQLGYKFAETNVEYESNEAVQALWKYFEHKQHKRRRCYLKYFINSTRAEDNI